MGNGSTAATEGSLEFRVTATLRLSLYRAEKFQPEKDFELGIADVAGIVVTLEACLDASNSKNL